MRVISARSFGSLTKVKRSQRRGESSYTLYAHAVQWTGQTMSKWWHHRKGQAPLSLFQTCVSWQVENSTVNFLSHFLAEFATTQKSVKTKAADKDVTPFLEKRFALCRAFFSLRTALNFSNNMLASCLCLDVAYTQSALTLSAFLQTSTSVWTAIRAKWENVAIRLDPISVFVPAASKSLRIRRLALVSSKIQF